VTKPEPHDAAINDAARSLIEWWADAGVEPVAPPPSARARSAPAPERRESRAPVAPEKPSAPRPQRVATPSPSRAGAPEDDAPRDARRLAAAASTIEELKTAIEGFEGCTLKATAQNTVFARGSMKSGVMIIGEAPGFDEDRQGLPFVGRSGQLLDRMFASIGLDREDIYVTNMLFWRPPKNRDPSQSDLAACMAFVERHIALAQPKVLVLAGKTSAQAILNSSEGIMRMRGKWGAYTPAAGDESQAQTIPALPIFHPAFLLRKPDFKRQTWRDLLSLQKRLEEG